MLMIQYNYNPEDPFQRGAKYGEETRTLMETQLQFMKETPFDTMNQWGKEELDFFNTVSFGMNQVE